MLTIEVAELVGEDVRYIDAVAVMTDTDDTGQQATANYGDIYFTAKDVVETNLE